MSAIEKQHGRAWSVTIMVLLLSAMVGLALLACTQYIIKPIVKKQIIYQVKKNIGLTIKISELNGNFINEIRLKNIETVEVNSPIQLSLSILEINYNLIDLVFGINKFLRSVKLVFGETAVELDLNLDQGPSIQHNELLSNLPVILFEDIKIKIKRDHLTAVFMITAHAGSKYFEIEKLTCTLEKDKAEFKDLTIKLNDVFYKKNQFNLTMIESGKFDIKINNLHNWMQLVDHQAADDGYWPNYIHGFGEVDNHQILIYQSDIRSPLGAVLVENGRYQLNSTRNQKWWEAITGKINLTINNIRPFLKLLDLPDATGSIKASININEKAKIKTGNYKIDGRAIAIDKILVDKIGLHGTLDMELSGSQGTPDLIGQLDIKQAAINDLSLARIMGSFKMHNSNLIIQEAKIKDQNGDLMLTGVLPIDLWTGKINTTGYVKLQSKATINNLSKVVELFYPARAGLVTKGDAEFDLTIVGNWDNPQGQIKSQINDLRLVNKLGTHETIIGLTASSTVDKKQIIIKQLDVTSGLGTLRAQGGWEHQLVQQQLANIKLFSPTGKLHGRASLRLNDLQLLNPYLSQVKGLEGSCHIDLDLSGTKLEPHWQGDLSLEKGVLRFISESSPAFKGLDLKAQLIDKQMLVKKLTGKLGASPFGIKGKITYQSQGKLISDLVLKGEELLLWRDDNMRVRANVDLNLQGPLATIEVNGKITLRDTRYQKNVDYFSFLKSNNRQRYVDLMQGLKIENSILSSWQYNVSISSDHPVVLKNNLIDSQLLPDLVLYGSGAYPFISGTVAIKSMTLMLPAGNLKVKTGALKFLKNKPDNPQLEFLAQGRMKGYDISMNGSGELDEPKIQLTSQPPLPGTDLLLLLMTGALPDKSTGKRFQPENNLALTAFISREFLNLFKSSQLTNNDSLLDRFEIEVGRNITPKGQETIALQFKLMDNVITGRDQLYLSSERDEYDDYNGGGRIVFQFE